MFDTVCIVGVGLIGGSFGLALRERKLARRVVGAVRRQATIDEALALGAIDEGLTDLAEAVRHADLVLMAPPVGQMIPLCRQIADVVPSGALITDAGSTKASFVDECEAIFGTRAHFVGGHPMAGSEQTGVSAARGDLFVGATWVLTPTPTTAPPALATLAALVEAVGAKPLVMDARSHDAILASTSHLPHVTASALVHQFLRARGGSELAEQLIAGGWRDSTRVAAGSGEMWRDICLANSQAIDEALGALVSDLENVRRWVREGQGDKLRDWFDEAATARRAHGHPPRKSL
jgi:prephenate dehydrogenase